MLWIHDLFHVELTLIFLLSRRHSSSITNAEKDKNYSCHNLLIPLNGSTWNISAHIHPVLIWSFTWNKCGYDKESLSSKYMFHVEYRVTEIVLENMSLWFLFHVEKVCIRKTWSEISFVSCGTNGDIFFFKILWMIFVPRGIWERILPISSYSWELFHVEQ
mgnify:CR=1 FL=1